MPIATQLTFIRDTIDGLVLPYDLGTLLAVTDPPPAPTQTIEQPTAWVWASAGSEERQTVPRAVEGNLNTGGNKEQTPEVSVWLRWDSEVSGDPDEGLWWPSIVDAVMGRLRNVALLDGAQHATDPATGRLSNLLDVGERMEWQMPPAEALTETTRRYDALVVCSLVDIFQA